MSSSRSPLPPGIVIALAGTLAAQTYVVDAAGGGNFTDLRQAVATVPSGAVLRVRKGIYLAFTLQSKSLTIIGDSQDGVHVWGGDGNATTFYDVVLGPTSPTQRIVLKNLTVHGTHDFSNIKMTLANLAGPVWLEDVAITGNGNASCKVTVTNCPDVHWLRCTHGGGTFGGASVVPELSLSASAVQFVDSTIISGGGTPGLRADASQVTLVSTAVGSGSGVQVFGSGWSAILVSGSSTLHAYGNTRIRGGSSMTGPGGNGIEATASSIVLAGVTPEGGTGTVPGQALKLDPASTLRTVAGLGPNCFLLGNLAPGNGISVNLRANVGDVALLVFGDTPLYAPAPPWLTLGTLFVAPLATVGPLTVPANGVLSIPLQVPTLPPLDQLYLVQFLVLPSAPNEVWASNSTSLLVRS